MTKRSAVVEFAHANDGKNFERSLSSSIGEFDPSRTVQASAVDADINVLVKRFGLTGQMPQARRVPEYGDFSGITDYQSALNELIKLDSAFAELPADTRARFGNDPGEMYKFLQDPENLAEARELGLVLPEKPVPPPTRVEVVNAAPAAPVAPATS